ncbi:hypothetical protein [Kiloniella sp. b19]|uniref:hypothetical protein n=1 Tax=Kiloniella sp. GXU_MW_B19 TaxID=3141326 RepID=UPI0031E23157
MIFGNQSASPYLDKNGQRLKDVLAAIQIMAEYSRYSASLQRWIFLITGTAEADQTSADLSYWGNVFNEHSEFFRTDQNGKIALIHRRVLGFYDIDSERDVSLDERGNMSEADRKRTSRRRLTPEQLTSLMTTAIHLHAAALQAQQARKWWVAPSLGVVGIVLGAFVTAWLKGEGAG